MQKTAIVIGAGLGGLATAIRLAREGWKVKVLEKNIRVGGKLDCYSEKGFLWDVGPSMITMPFLIRDLFECSGHEVEDYLDLVPVDPVCRYFFQDGKVVNKRTNFHHFRIEVARQEKDHGEALNSFVKYTQGIYDLLTETYFFAGSKSSKSLLSWQLLKNLHHLPKVRTSKTMAKVVEQHFKDPHIRQIFRRYALNTGSSPFRAPSVLNVLSHVEMEGGAWYIRGGVYRLAESLENCARDLQVEVLGDAEVSQIVLKKGAVFHKPRAAGVSIRGATIEADAVICNADVTHAWSRLLNIPKQNAVMRSFEKKTFSTAPFMILWGVKQQYDKLAHHNIFFTSNDANEFEDLFQKRRPPLEPTISVSISSRTDVTQAPAGQDNYLVTVHVPPLDPDHHWEQIRSKYRDLILERLQKMGLPNLEKDILCEKIITPSDFSARSHAYRGAIYGQACHSLSDIKDRPPHRCEEVDGLYFVGGTSRPIGGIPGVLLSAQKVAQTVHGDLG